MTTMTAKRITEWTLEDVKALNAEVEAALRDLAQGHGLTVKGTKGVVQPNQQDALLTFQFTLEGAADKKSERDWERYAPEFGLKVSDFGHRIRVAGRIFTVAGINPAARKRPLVMTDEKGKRYVVGLEDVEWL